MPITRSGYSTRPRRNGSTRAYRQARAQALNGDTHCAICHQPFQPGQPIEADHRVPHSHGGADTTDNLRAVHRHCNRARGNAS